MFVGEKSFCDWPFVYIFWFGFIFLFYLVLYLYIVFCCFCFIAAVSREYCLFHQFILFSLYFMSNVDTKENFFFSIYSNSFRNSDSGYAHFMHQRNRFFNWLMLLLLLDTIIFSHTINVSASMCYFCLSSVFVLFLLFYFWNCFHNADSC